MSRMKRNSLLLVILLILMLGVVETAAAKKKKKQGPGEGLTEDELYQLAVQKLEKKKTKAARELLKDYQLRYPQGKYSIETKLGLADSYFMEKSIESKAEGLAEYRSFLTFYPRHPLACKAQFHVAQYYYHEMARPQRDQTNTRKAVEELQKLLESYPECEYATRGKELLQKARDRLSDSDFIVGTYYFRLKCYAAAAGRFEHLLKENPEYGGREEVYQHLCRAYRKLGEKEKAGYILEKLRADYPRSKYLRRLDKSAS
jgi:outer membrane protein assembly factor BamD